MHATLSITWTFLSAFSGKFWVWFSCWIFLVEKIPPKPRTPLKPTKTEEKVTTQTKAATETKTEKILSKTNTERASTETKTEKILIKTEKENHPSISTKLLEEKTHLENQNQVLIQQNLETCRFIVCSLSAPMVVLG